MASLAIELLQVAKIEALVSNLGFKLFHVGPKRSCGEISYAQLKGLSSHRTSQSILVLTSKGKLRRCVAVIAGVAIVRVALYAPHAWTSDVSTGMMSNATSKVILEVL